MPKTVEGHLSAAGKRFALVVGRFNSFLTEQLQNGAVDCLLRHGAAEEAIWIFKVPGSFEIPAAVNRVLQQKRFDAVIALGVLIRGATPHFDYIAAEVSKGLGNLALQAEVPVTFGVITADSVEQAIERAGTKAGNKGWEAAMAAIEMVNLFENIETIQGT